MPYVTNDFQCTSCEHEFHEMWARPAGSTAKEPWKGEVECPECGGKALKLLVSTPGIAAYSIQDKEGRAAILKERSQKHSKKLMKKNMDKHRAYVQGKVDAIKGG